MLLALQLSGACSLYGITDSEKVVDPDRNDVRTALH